MKDLSPVSGDIFYSLVKPTKCKILRWDGDGFLQCTTSASKVEVLSYRHLTPIQAITRFLIRFCLYLKWSVIKVCTVEKTF